MRKIKNEDLAELLMQVRFAPAKQRQKQLGRAEELLDIIEKDKEYPFEFVCFKITGYRPEEKQGIGLSGVMSWRRTCGFLSGS